MRAAGLDGGAAIGRREERERGAIDGDGEVIRAGVAGEKRERVGLEHRQRAER